MPEPVPLGASLEATAPDHAPALGEQLARVAETLRSTLPPEQAERALAELQAAALEHERRFELERQRQRRREKLEALLPTIAEALDVRQVFLGLSAVIQEIVPHDVLAFSLLTPDRSGVKIQAATHEGMRE